MQSEKGDLSTAQKAIIALLIAAGLAALVYFLYLWWTQPPCPTCHIERNSSVSGTRSDEGCFINGRIADWMSEGPLVAELNGSTAADLADAKNPVPGYLKNECVNIPVPCPPTETPKLSFSLIGQSDVRWDNPLCKDGADCPLCKE